MDNIWVEETKPQPSSTPDVIHNLGIKVLHRIADGLNETGIVTNTDHMFFRTFDKNAFIVGFGIDSHIGDNIQLMVLVSCTGSTSYDDDTPIVFKGGIGKLFSHNYNSRWDEQNSIIYEAISAVLNEKVFNKEIDPYDRTSELCEINVLSYYMNERRAISHSSDPGFDLGVSIGKFLGELYTTHAFDIMSKIRDRGEKQVDDMLNNMFSTADPEAIKNTIHLDPAGAMVIINKAIHLHTNSPALFHQVMYRPRLNAYLYMLERYANIILTKGT